MPEINGVMPFFIVRSMDAALATYRDRLGFTVAFLDPPEHPFFAIVQRDGAALMLKHVGVAPEPNPQRHPDARWDAYFDVTDPDALAEELRGRGVEFSVPLGDTHEGLRGFEVRDADGHALFFGRPR
jgi:catechol 2,3-dioxygenase-like lactoylglutathione lyase family enzyme